MAQEHMLRGGSRPAGSSREPDLKLHGDQDNPGGVVLLMHGGKVSSHQPVSRGNLAALRVRRFAGAFTHGGPASALAVGVLRNRYRGWNAPADHASLPDPVRDAEWALDRIGRRFGTLPVVLVGHSLGGRAALAASGFPTVRGVAALAPWLPPGEPVAHLAGRSVLIAHGDRDRVTDARLSTAYARRAVSSADAVYLRSVHGDGHAMLRHAAEWHRLVHDFALGVLGLADMPEDIVETRLH